MSATSRYAVHQLLKENESLRNTLTPLEQLREQWSKKPIFSREFAMGNAQTFLLPPVWKLLARYINPQDFVVDPFARNAKWGTVTNDLNPDTEAEYHELAENFVQRDFKADVLLFDPPYSPRQIAECYQHIGKKVTGQDTQNARLYKRIKDGLDRMLKPGGIAICCGWNSMGFGLNRGYEMLEILLVPHGAAHNDTIVTVERKNACEVFEVKSKDGKPTPFDDLRRG